MRIAFHLGLHCTDEGRLVRSMLRSRAELAPEGVHVPPPRRYRSLLRETLNILNGAPAPAEVQRLLIDTLIDTEDVQRLVLFHESLICIPSRAISEEGLYPMAPRRLAAFANLFPDHQTEFFLALCNPATMVPTLAARAGPDGYETVMAGANPLRLSWLATIRRAVEANPGLRLTLWCNEDTPFLWPEVLRAIAGHETPGPLEGDLDLLAALLTDEGLAALQADLAERPPVSVVDWRERAIDALEHAARPEEMEIEVALPGWTDETVARLTEQYLRDCAAIAALPGVEFLAP